MFPSRISAHFEWVPGSRATPENPGWRCEEAEQLGFLAPHYVLAPRTALADAGKNARGETEIRAEGADRAAAQFVEIGRGFEIGRFEPALAGAGHAADDDFERPADMGADQLAEDGRERIGG